MTALTIVQILTMVITSEAAILHNDDALVAVGSVYMNRYNSGQYGSTPLEVAYGFNGFIHAVGLDTEPHHEYIASLIVDGTLKDNTKGSLFILSLHDVKRVYREMYPYAMVIADYKSPTRCIDGETYGLLAYKVLPNGRVLDLVKDLYGIDDIELGMTDTNGCIVSYNLRN